MVRGAVRGGELAREEGGDRALARKLLVALWKYAKQGEPPGGAEVVAWDRKPPAGGGLPARKAS
jgi:hypothetical protein